MRSPFELKSLIEWLEKQPAEREYDYSSTKDCLLHKYFTAVGFTKVVVGGATWQAAEFGERPISGDFFQVVNPSNRPWTFGAALQRARLLDAQ